ncbi:glycoside hydrolase family 73 protein [uncultured Ruegeria sp.]|uniref:glycoside hydrolase family 73 protein n=1 Tax=uncultured Ruegeria sp. TaxID=259304 RepID=UPI002618839B|nr:glucosaminidase domain-containing protein [uncultured Ruegeria sp.]
MFAPENADRTAMALYGIGELLKGNSAAPAMDGLMQMSKFEQEAAREKAERTEGLKLTTDIFRDLQGNTGSYTPPDPSSPAGIGADTMKALGKASFTPGDRDSFITSMLPYAQEAGKTTGLDPRLIVAQSALETGYGKSAPGNNFFGIKSHGLPGGNVLATTEFESGTNVSTRDSFRQYGGMGDSVAGYVDFLQTNPRYANMLAAEGMDAQLDALGKSGYATDPLYQQKVDAIARSIQMPGEAPQPRFANLSPERLAQVLHSDHVPPELKQMAVEQFRPQEQSKFSIQKLADGRAYYVDPTGRQDPRLVAPDLVPTPDDPADEYGRYRSEEIAAGRTPLSRIDYANAKKGNGFNVTTPDGTVVSYGGGQGSGFGTKATNEIEGRILDSGAMLGRLNDTRALFKPQYLEISTRIGAKWGQLMDKMGNATPEQQELVANFAQFKTEAFNNLNTSLKELSGAAVTPQEAERLLEQLPSVGTGILDGDSPTEFQAKLEQSIVQQQRAVARYNLWLATGRQGKPWEMGSLDDVDKMINARGAQIEEQLRAAGLTDESVIKQQVSQQLRVEVGF